MWVDRRVISFFVPGTPKPQGSKRAFLHKTTKKPIMVESGGKPLTDWRGDVKRAAMEAMGDRPLFEGPVGISLGFELNRPKSHPKTRPTWPIARPDIDKLGRSVLDALTAVCFKDDSQVVYLEMAKGWADVGRGSGVWVRFWDEAWEDSSVARRGLEAE
jgi:crossover junction endodeoxyribonuclease RusA